MGTIRGTNTKAIPVLRKLMAPVILRRKKADVMPQLPPITYGTTEIEAGPVDMELIFPEYYFPTNRGDELRRRLDAERAAVEAAMSVAANANAPVEPRLGLLESLKESVSAWRRYVGLQKVQSVVDLVTMELDCNAYDKVVIFACHQAVIEALRSKLYCFKAVTLYGGTPPEKREANIQKFQKDPRCRVFIGNIIAAGTNITLTAASQVLLVEPDWVPANNAQAVMRCHRIGQTRPVQVRVVTLAGDELEQKIMGTIRRKVRELTAIFDV